MIKLSLILTILFIISCSKITNQTLKDDRDKLLSNIEKGNLSSLIFEPNNLDVFTLGEDSVALMVMRKRMEFPTFSMINLYSAIAYDEKYQYSIYFSHEKAKCLIFVNDREVLKRVGECFAAFSKCIGEKKINDWDEDLVNKCSDIPICQNQEPMDKGSEIKNDYCSMIYGK